MNSPKANKQRVNISVDPSVHERFTQYAERNNQSVSGILNEVMDLFCENEDDRDMDSPVAQFLRQRLLAEDSSDFQRVVRKLVLDAGFKEIDMETNHGQTDEIPVERRSEWYGVVGKTKIGVKLAFDLSREPDITLGRAFLFRGIRKCDRVLLVVPYRLAIPKHVLTAIAQSSIDVVGADLLEEALRRRSRKEPPADIGGSSSAPNQKASDAALIRHLKANL